VHFQRRKSGGFCRLECSIQQLVGDIQVLKLQLDTGKQNQRMRLGWKFRQQLL